MEEHKGRFSFKGTIIVLVITVAVIGGGCSLLASSDPDGLEWAVGNTAGTEEVELGNRDPGVYEAAEAVQEQTSILPDYAFKENDSQAGTTVSGLVGAAIVAGIVAVVAFLGRYFRKRKKAAQT